MKSIYLLLTVLIFSPIAVVANSPKAQLEQASKAAVKNQKDLLIVFSGSSWNQRSKDFEAKVLKTAEFKKGAEKNFTQVIIDVPPTRQEASAGLLEFEKTYQFQTIPAVILADAKGRPYAYTGPIKGEAAEFLVHLKELHKVGVERDATLKSALAVKGKKRAELLVKALKALPQQSIPAFYEAELKMIEKADPKGETKYAGEIRKAEFLRKEQDRYNELFNAKKFEDVIKTAKAEGAKLKGEDAQRVKLYEVKGLFALKKYDEASKGVEALKKMAPDSDLGKRADQFIAQIQGAKTRATQMAEAAKNPKPKPNPRATTKPVVSKPVAIVSDINLLRKDTKKAEDDLAKALAKEVVLQKKEEALKQKIASAEEALKKLQGEGKSSMAALKKLSAEREKLARRSKAMKEVLENHEAMEKRKRDIAELEKKAAALQKQAEELRKKAGDIRKGK